MSYGYAYMGDGNKITRTRTNKSSYGFIDRTDHVTLFSVVVTQRKLRHIEALHPKYHIRYSAAGKVNR